MSIKLPTVSVCCITYNHEAYLAQAIESVLMQQTDFDVEMVIGEDCSPDNSRAIAQEYERRYPGRVRVLAHTQNLGIMRNLMATHAACQGEFIAYLEGDDYWIDSTKLQRQIDALRANPDCAFCFHDANVVFENQQDRAPTVFSAQATHALPSPSESAPPVRFTQLDLARVGWVVPSASMVFRACSLPQQLPEWFSGVYSGDYTLHLLSTRWGPALYLPRVMSYYRLHAQSISNVAAHSAFQFERRIYEGRMFQQHVFEPKNRKYADIFLAQQYGYYASYLGEQGKRKQQLSCLVKSMLYGLQRIPVYLERRLPRFFAVN
ncbi:glycosyltransferase [Hymenobacter sp. DH14]|uniref:Glycosyltransferase n=1 Tax=Hymenobacter cyanobacteriorum TaxID=2926463 RepID=A0A9X1VKW4_9BACT|nr:glycosyltransferase [Hymenobacter cyanobacteriorum]MCI1188900.1 glycosyltransferase [Hymenobacter cyanobacteriorum]